MQLMKIVVEDTNVGRIANFGSGILQSYLKSSFLAFQNYLLSKRFNQCKLNLDTINTNNHTVELQYTGNLSIEQLYAELKEWEYYRSFKWTFHIVN